MKGERLTTAYQAQRDLYVEILRLVREQGRIMREAPDPCAVLRIARDVEGLLEEIAHIEETIEPLKSQWQGNKQALPEGLDAVLEQVQGLIERIAGTQQQVGQQLLDYVREQTGRTEETRARVNACRARAAYARD